MSVARAARLWPTRSRVRSEYKSFGKHWLNALLNKRYVTLKGPCEGDDVVYISRTVEFRVSMQPAICFSCGVLQRYTSRGFGAMLGKPYELEHVAYMTGNIEVAASDGRLGPSHLLLLKGHDIFCPCCGRIWIC